MTDDQPLLPEHAAEKPTDSASECPKTNADKPIFIITGLSGAGKSTVLHVFEDMRLFTADGGASGTHARNGTPSAKFLR